MRAKRKPRQQPKKPLSAEELLSKALWEDYCQRLKRAAEGEPSPSYEDPPPPAQVIRPVMVRRETVALCRECCRAESCHSCGGEIT